MFQRLGGAAASVYRFGRPYISISTSAGADLSCTGTTTGRSSAVPRRSRSMATTPRSGGSEVVRFADFDVTDQVFLRTEHVVGIVNLKPIVPFRELPISGDDCLCSCSSLVPLTRRCFAAHFPLLAPSCCTSDVLLIPPSPSITRLSLLPTASLAPFFRAVQLVTSRLEEVTGASSTNVAIQDGKEAGQSVAHLHVHVLPRKRCDEYAESDEVSISRPREERIGEGRGERRYWESSLNLSRLFCAAP
jgi:bis(5'-adenosyl)-triphosphatase